MAHYFYYFLLYRISRETEKSFFTFKKHRLELQHTMCLFLISLSDVYAPTVSIYLSIYLRGICFCFLGNIEAGEARDD